jgi:transposase
VGQLKPKIGGMSYEIEANYKEQWLFPPSLEDLVPAGHPARLVREFVEAIDLQKLGFRSRAVDLGRPNYSASLLTKVFLYGYMNRIRSCRALERACMNEMGLLWLTGMNYPDHTTLWRFWNDNRAAIRKLFKQLLQIALSANLIGMVLHAVDGTKVLSQASESQGWHRAGLQKKLKKLDRAIEEILKQTEQAGPDNSVENQLPADLQQRQQLRELIQGQLKQLDQKQRDHLQPKDEDARVMKTGSRNDFAYNAQAVVDQQSKLIVASDVVSDESDNAQLVPMIEQVQENVGRAAEETLGDGGYFATVELAAAEGKKFSVLVNLPESVTGTPNQPYHASRFVYDSIKDHCVCPRGVALPFDSTRPRDKARPYVVRVYRCPSYETCPVRWQCSASKTGRTVQIHPNHDALVRQREKLRDPAMRAMLKQRGAIVEAVFGWAKEGMGFRRWTVRGRDKVTTQWSLLCTAMNLRRLHAQWVSGKLRFA